MPTTPRMSWPYPAENLEQWFDAFKSFAESMDSSGFASREDRHLILSGGGTVSWSSTTSVLSWSSAITIVSPITGFQIQIAATSATIENGEVLYVPLTRAPTQNLTVAALVAGQVPNNDLAFTLAIRIGTRIYWRNGLLLDNGESVSNLGSKQAGLSPGTPGVEFDWGGDHQYSQLAVPVEETIGYGLLNGSNVGALSVYFRSTWNPQFTVAGSASVRLYDLGPAAGPPVAPTLIATLSVSSSGLVYTEQALTVGVSPGANQIQNTARMYEVTVYQSSQVGDSVHIGSVGITLR